MRPTAPARPMLMAAVGRAAAALAGAEVLAPPPPFPALVAELPPIVVEEPEGAEAEERKVGAVGPAAPLPPATPPIVLFVPYGMPMPIEGRGVGVAAMELRPVAALTGTRLVLMSEGRAEYQLRVSPALNCCDAGGLVVGSGACSKHGSSFTDAIKETAAAELVAAMAWIDEGKAVARTRRAEALAIGSVRCGGTLAVIRCPCYLS